MQEIYAHLIGNFYSGFKHGDHLAMQKCYHPDVEFSDEVFPLLKGRQVLAMWHMLVTGGKDAGLQISYSQIEVFKDTGKCDWEATYKFTLTGRDVHNSIHAKFLFKGDLIIRHVDHFNFWKWSRMAFGFKGLILGWAPFFKNKVRSVMATRLEKFIANHPEYYPKENSWQILSN